MATEAVNAPINGTYGSHQANPYTAAEPSFAGQQANGAPSTTSQPEVSKEEVAWYFVESYYTTMSRTPEKLYVGCTRVRDGTFNTNWGIALLQQAIAHGTRCRGTESIRLCWAKGKSSFQEDGL